MKKSDRGLIISQIIYNLNLVVKRKNKELVKNNMHSDQTPLHGVETVLKLAFLTKKDFDKSVKAAGV